MMFVFGCLAGMFGITGLIWLVSSLPKHLRNKRFDRVLFVLGSVFLVQATVLANFALHPSLASPFMLAWGVGSVGLLGLGTALVFWKRKLLNKNSLIGFMALFLLLILLVVWNFIVGPPLV